MTNKPQRAVRLTEPQLEFLRQEAARHGITISEMIRKIIDQYMQQKE